MPTGKSRRQANSPKDRIVASMELIRAVYADGQELLKRCRKENCTRGALVREEAVRRQINSDYLWKALAFADAKTGFTKAQVDQLCRSVSRHKRIVGRAFVAKLLTVPRADRMKLAEVMLRDGWSLSELDAELVRRYGRRRQGGRRPKMLASLGNVLLGLDQRCVSWSRFADYLLRSPQEDPPGHRLIHVEDLPGEVRQAVIDVNRAMGELTSVVRRELRRGAQAVERKTR